MNVVDSPPGMTSPSSPWSCSALRTSTTWTPSRRSIAVCSREFPWAARTPMVILRFCLLHPRAAVLVDRLARDRAGVVREQPRDRTRDLLRLRHAAERHFAHRRRERLLLRARERVESLPGHVRLHPARADR